MAAAVWSSLIPVSDMFQSAFRIPSGLFLFPSSFLLVYFQLYVLLKDTIGFAYAVLDGYTRPQVTNCHVEFPNILHNLGRLKW